MKRSKFTDAQVAFVLPQAQEGTTVADVCRKAVIGQAIHFNWKKKYAGLMPSEMKRLRRLEWENGRLKRIVADLSLDKEMLQDVIRESCETCPDAAAGRRGSISPAGLDPPRLHCAAI